jgi:hypothetical protein
MSSKPTISGMMDVGVIARSTLIGALLQAVLQCSSVLGHKLYESYYADSAAIAVVLVISVSALVGSYIVWLNPVDKLRAIIRSGRFDLLIFALIGAGMSAALISSFGLGHLLNRLDGTICGLALALLVSSVASAMLRDDKAAPCGDPADGFAFLPDKEVDDEALDVLKSQVHAKNFAAVVAKETARSPMVFGVDGPWGVGKSTFINFAHRAWEDDKDIVVFRFEPLKFGSEKDMVRAFIQELSGQLRSRFFAPELRPLASRYARMVKTDASVSVPGLRLSIDPDGSTIDEIVLDVNEALRRERKRVIAVIDDLDRIDHETVRKVLFMARRSMVANRISYVLVYDTERLVSDSGDGSTREYLEKFVNAKVSLYVDLERLGAFLRDGWKLSLPKGQAQQSARVIGLQSILSDMADMLEGSSGGHYAGMVGNIRKIKRLINAMLLIGIESVELNQTDFSRRDLIHLIMLSVGYPGVFREIYRAEGESRSGIFSVRHSWSGSTLIHENHSDFQRYLDGLDRDSKFLVTQLFDVDSIDIRKNSPTKEQYRSLACFNSQGRRNLSSYLALIVRLIVPDPMETAAMYEGVLRDMRARNSIRTVLGQSVVANDPLSQVKLWSSFAASSQLFDEKSRLEAIDSMIELLPTYESRGTQIPSPRSSVVYSLATSVNSAFGPIIPGDPRSSNAISLMRALILGGTAGKGIMERLGEGARGTLGMHDMMLFRLLCCPDRGNQLNNIHLALASERFSKIASNQRAGIAVDAVRAASQLAFSLFKNAYIDSGRNFLVESRVETGGDDPEVGSVQSHWVAGFVVYQLTNAFPPTGSGVGCGFFDEEGEDDGGGVSMAMNSYLFDHCFNPAGGRENVLAFADYCLANFSKDYFDGDGPKPTRQSLEEGLNGDCFGKFWRLHHAKFKAEKLELLGREVVTNNYTSSYSSDIEQVWKVLDEAYLADGSQKLAQGLGGLDDEGGVHA